MATITQDQLLEAGVHFGHLSRKWNPHMAPYIFMQRNSIHIIDLNKTEKMLEQACLVARQLAVTGRKIMFVGTKKQAKDVIRELAIEVNMPYVTERWLGGMLTNFATVRKSVKKLQSIEKMELDGTFDLLQKKERLMLSREKAKLEAVLGGITELNRLPAALFVVDIVKEHIAIAEARKLNIPTIAIVDTNSNPNVVDFPIPGNDDAAKSIHLLTKAITDSIREGLEERKLQKEKEKDEEGKDKEKEQA
ncbi:MAG: 30S ribosomal protein S2 [Bacteroidetes bacterium]|jgi:small subunit ribosomal protein S2|nr:30S ribosomal protein S2 [Bacteroidota bacterium]